MNKIKVKGAFNMAYEYEKIEYFYDKEYEDILEQIEELREELALTPVDFDEIVIKDTYDNVSIEGNQISYFDVTKILTNDVTIRGNSLKDHLQVKNHNDTLNILKNFVLDTDLKITPSFIKQIHFYITNGELSAKECGSYRQEPVSIRFTNYIPPMEWELDFFVKELCDILYSPLEEESDFERICEFKRNFERIHPFVDGNGRTGRLLMNLLFLQKRYGYVSIPSEERDLYFNSLDDNTFHKFAAKKMLLSLEKIKDDREREERKGEI